MLSKILLIMSLLSVISTNTSPICQLCHVVASVVQKSLPLRPIDIMLDQIGTIVCIKKDIQDKQVCKGAVTEMASYILVSLWKHHSNPHLVCQTVNFCGKQVIKRNITKQINQIIKDKPDKQWQHPSQKNILKIMHISDLHPDLFYSPGAPVDCVEPVCCRSNVSAKKNSSRIAGYWGSTGLCDLPLHTFQLFLQQVRQIEPDAIIWTGDNTPHDIWQQTQSYNLNFTHLLSQKLKQYTNATIIPAMGNHQSWPVNVYDYRSNRQNVLNGGLAEAWKSWLSEQAQQMLRTKGYFAMNYPKLNNLKVISINTQAGNDMNWFLIQNPTDPGQTLKWLENQLKQSEQKEEKVYIVGHIPPNNNINQWGMRFNAIVDRYSYIIRGQFYGHTHSDHFAFFPDFKTKDNIDTTKLSNFYLVAPSLTTYSDRIPEYRVMEVDFDTLQVLDFSQYRLDLRKNYTSEDHPSFELFYTFRESFNISNMVLQDGITQLRNKMRDDPNIQKLYSYHKNGGLEPGHQGRNIFCDTTTSRQFQSQCNGGHYKNSPFQKAAGPWWDLNHK